MIDDVPVSVEYIISKINEWNTKIISNNGASLYDINNFSENFCRDIINIIFKVNLENANLFRKNQSAIDLKDDINKIAIQVTSDKSLAKIKHTVEEFVDNGYNEKYDMLKIIVLAFKPKSNRSDYSYKGYTFEQKNVIFFNDLIILIKDCTPKDIYKIRELFEYEYKNYKDMVEIQRLKVKIKQKKYLSSEAVKRNVIKLSDYNEYYPYSFNKKDIDINNLISSKNKILILGEAASGKTFYLKNIADELNNTEFYFSFYYQLNTYIDNKIEEFIPDEYSQISTNRIVLILDGLDEIEEKYRIDFYKRLNYFMEKNESVIVILSCRTNFHKSEKQFLEGYEEYLLDEFSDEEVLKFLQIKNINYNDFILKVENKEYGFMLHNPFYLNILSDLYIANTTFPNKTEILAKSIEHIFSEDIRKYKMNLNIKDIQKNQRIAIQKMGFILECLGRNYLTDSELKSLINSKDYKYLEYCGIVKCVNNNWSFIHNNFGEYLASLELGNLAEKDFKLAVFNKHNKKVKHSWYNTIAFYIMNNPDENLLNYILKNNPELVFNVEKDKIPENKKALIFKKILDYYMQNKIWVPSEFVYNSKFVEFFSVYDVYDYLCEIIVKNEHYVQTHNALEIMIKMVNYISNSKIFDITNNLLYSKEYNKDDRKNALYILANGRFGDENYLRKVIEDLKNEEEQYLKTGYFYYINRMNLVDTMIEEIFNFKSAVGSMVVAKWKNDDGDDEDEENINLADEHYEFSKMFKNIKNLNSINYIIEQLKKDENKKERFDEYIIKDICFSIENLSIDDKLKNESLFKLYLIFLENYNRTSSIHILKVIDKKGKRKELFKYYLENNKEFSRYELYSFIDNSCASYFYEEYKNNEYSDDLAELVISSLIYDTKEYNLIKEVYESKTGKKIPIPYIPVSEKQKNLLHQECFNSIFNKKDFKDLIDYFFDLINLDKIKVREILSAKHERWDDVKFEYISYTLYHSFKDKEKIIERSKIEKILDGWNWDIFIIEELVNFLDHHDSIQINDKQLNIIKNICDEWLKEADFSTAITHTSPTSSNINIKCLRLAYLKRKLNLSFPENILLDMLEFEFIENGREVGISEIVKEVGYEKSKQRILNNLKDKELLGDTLENHIQFCIDNEVYQNKEEIYSYFISDKLSVYTKGKCFEYLIKSNDMKYIYKILKEIGNYDDSLWGQLSFVLSQNMSKNILKILKKEIKNINNTNIKMFVYCEMIKQNMYFGIKKYYQWMRANQKTYSEELNKSVSSITKLRYIIIDLKIFQLTFNKSFKDKRFESLYSNIKNSIVLIGKKNGFNKKIVTFLIRFLMFINRKHKHVGFVNYILIDLETNQKAYSEEMTIDEIKIILKN